MNAILSFLLKLFPTLFPKIAEKKGTILSTLLLCATLAGMYSDLSSSLSTAKAARDEQIKGYAVQIGVLHSESESHKEDIEKLRGWLKSVTERVNNQEREALERQSAALENRINRLEDAAMRGKRR